MATLVFLKEKGLSTADIFRGTFNGPDDNPSEWDYLTRDPRWQTQLQFLILEYVEQTQLPAVYRSKLRKVPQLFFLVPGAQPIEYKEKLAYPTLQNWVLQNMALLASAPAVVEEEVPVLISVPSSSSSPTNKAPAANNSNNTSAASSNGQAATTSGSTSTATPNSGTTETLASTEGGVSMPGAIVGGGMILFGFAMLGAILGTALSPDEDDTPTPGILTHDDGSAVDFSAIKWDEEVRPKWKLPAFLGGKKDETEPYPAPLFVERQPASAQTAGAGSSSKVNSPKLNRTASGSPGLLNGDDDEVEAEL